MGRQAFSTYLFAIARAGSILGLLLAGCGDDSAASDGAADGRLGPDGRPDAGSLDARGADGAPWQHTITIDGDVADWIPGGEQFDTTSYGDFFLYLTWDATHVYLAVEGDLTIEPASTWFVACFDADPGASTGADTGELLGSHRPSFPNGFGAEHCYKRRLDGASAQLSDWDGASDWVAGASTNAAQGTGFLEVAVPRAGLGDPAQLGIVALLMDAVTPERAYAGLYQGSFTDGTQVGTIVPIAYYFAQAFATEDPPNDPRHRQP